MLPETVEQSKAIEILTASPSFTFVDGFPEFLYSAVVYIHEEKFFRGVVHRHVGNSLPDIDEVTDIREIPLEIFPLYDRELFGTIVENLDPKYYVKRPHLTQFRDVSSDSTAELMEAEAVVFNALRKSPHKNIVVSHGCVVSDGRVTAFCLPKLCETLGQRITVKKQNVDIQTCMQPLRSAVEHLHELGLVHNDLNPENIMFDENDRMMLIDFDSCKPFGEKLKKLGTPKWNGGHSPNSCKENDLKALTLIERYLENGGVTEEQNEMVFFSKMGSDVARKIE